MNKKNFTSNLLIFFLSILSQNICGQHKDEIGVLFYNVENLFDTYDDTIKTDEEFLPEGARKWNYKKYNQKINHIGRVIFESGQWNLPVIIGLCEIENSGVLKDLIYSTGLSKLSYNYIHYESSDKRGIDVALLYKSKQFTPLESRPVKINFSSDSRPTRDILYTYGLYNESIPLHIFVCHFPSRYGGVMESQHKRVLAAQTLCDTINQINKLDKLANIIVMGDFNDNPDDISISQIIKETNLVNLSTDMKSLNDSQGTLKHKFEWNIFDQMLVSENLNDSTNDMSISDNLMLQDFEFLLEDDLSYTGKKPYRTYIGYKYNNGYSDHLPILLKLNPNR